MDFAEAWISVKKQKVLSEQLQRMVDGASLRYMRLHVWSEYGGGIGFYLEPKGFYKRELVFVVEESECLDKTDEEVAALVEQHMPGYAARVEACRAERKRRQRIRVQRNNEQISWKREQARKNSECDVCRRPVVGAIRRRKYCSDACRQRAHRHGL